MGLKTKNFSVFQEFSWAGDFPFKSPQNEHSTGTSGYFMDIMGDFASMLQ